MRCKNIFTGRQVTQTHIHRNSYPERVSHIPEQMKNKDAFFFKDRNEFREWANCCCISNHELSNQSNYCNSSAGPGIKILMLTGTRNYQKYQQEILTGFTVRSCVSGSALTLSTHRIAWRTIHAAARFRAADSVKSNRAGMLTRGANPTGGATASSRFRITDSAVLALASLFTTQPVFALFATCNRSTGDCCNTRQHISVSFLNLKTCTLFVFYKMREAGPFYITSCSYSKQFFVLLNVTCCLAQPLADRIGTATKLHAATGCRLKFRRMIKR